MRHIHLKAYRWLLLLILIGLACQLSGQKEEEPATPISPTGVTVISVTPTPSQIPNPTIDTSLPTATAVPTATNLPPTETAVPTATNTPIPWTQRSTIGYSVQERPIEIERIGRGDRWFVVLAALHGGHECNTTDLAVKMIERFAIDQTLLPEDVTLYVAPLINPDGCTADSRHNANGVDLNRNWATSNWTADAEGPAGTITGSGGPFPFSEAESATIQFWLQQLHEQSPTGELIVVSYHSVVSTGLAQPAYAVYGQPEPRSEVLARQYAAATDYLYSAVWVGSYTITGEFIHWAGENGIIAFDVELPDRNNADTIPVGWTQSHLETNLRGLLTILNFQ